MLRSPSDAGHPLCICRPSNYMSQQSGERHVEDELPVPVGQPLIATQLQYRREWRDGICACCNDCCSCWAVICFPNIVMSQLVDRLLCKGWCIAAYVTLSFFSMLVYVLLPVLFLYQHRYSECDSYYGCFYQPLPVRMTLPVVGYILLSASLTALLMKIRRLIRTRDGIQDACGSCGDICCSFWCSSCTLCQMMRHATSGSSYVLCSDQGVDDVAV